MATVPTPVGRPKDSHIGSDAGTHHLETLQLHMDYLKMTTYLFKNQTYLLIHLENLVIQLMG